MSIEHRFDAILSGLCGSEQDFSKTIQGSGEVRKQIAAMSTVRTAEAYSEWLSRILKNILFGLFILFSGVSPAGSMICFHD